MGLVQLCCLFGLLATVHSDTQPPNLIMVLMDDLGWYDVPFNNPNLTTIDSNITALRASGLQLNRHYVHWHCSPSRRVFLTGRLAFHHRLLDAVGCAGC